MFVSTLKRPYLCRWLWPVAAFSLFGCFAKAPNSGRPSDSTTCVPELTIATECPKCGGVCAFKNDCGTQIISDRGVCSTDALLVCSSQTCASKGHECGDWKNDCSQKFNCGTCASPSAICGQQEDRTQVCCTPTAAEACKPTDECGFRPVASCDGYIPCGPNDGECDLGETCDEETFKCVKVTDPGDPPDPDPEPDPDPPAAEALRNPELETGKNLCPIGAESTATTCTKSLNDLCTDECPADKSRCLRDPGCDPNGWVEACINAYSNIYQDAKSQAAINASCGSG